MWFISLLKKIGKGAEVVGKEALTVGAPALTVAATIDPSLAPMAALVSGISRSVLAQGSSTAASIDKKSAVLVAVESMAPVFGELVMANSGHAVTDNARFAAGVDQIIEGVLDVYKSFEAVPATPKVAS